MAEYISFQPSDFFNTKLYTGTGSSNAITGVGFQPDATWIKGRNTTYNHVFTDAVRGVTEEIYSNTTGAEVTNAQGLTAFGSDGFTVGTDAGYNGNTNTYVSWNWKGGTTSGIATNGSTTITPSAYSFNQTSGCSIIKYTGNGTAGAKLAHGLGATPDFFIIKGLDATTDWDVYHSSLGATKWLELNADGSVSTSTNRWNDTEPDSVNITLGDSTHVNDSSDFVAYCFSAKRGYSKFSSYAANGNADGAFIYTGFRPAFILLKDTATNAWYLMDSKRDGYNAENKGLIPSQTSVEQAGSYGVDFLSNGFKCRTTDGWTNGSGLTYLYAAFAEFPLVSSNDIPTVAR